MIQTFIIKLQNNSTQQNICKVIDMLSRNYTEAYQNYLSFISAYQCVKEISLKSPTFDDKVVVQESGRPLNFGKTTTFTAGECMLLVQGDGDYIDKYITRLVNPASLSPTEVCLWQTIDIVPAPEEDDELIQFLAVNFKEVLSETMDAVWK